MKMYNTEGYQFGSSSGDLLVTLIYLSTQTKFISLHGDPCNKRDLVRITYKSKSNLQPFLLHFLEFNITILPWFNAKYKFLNQLLTDLNAHQTENELGGRTFYHYGVQPYRTNKNTLIEHLCLPPHFDYLGRQKVKDFCESTFVVFLHF